MSGIYQFEIEKADEGQRLDRYLALAVPALSRSAIQRLIRDGDVSVDGELTALKHRVQTGERVSLRIPPPSCCSPRSSTHGFGLSLSGRALRRHQQARRNDRSPRQDKRIKPW